LVNKVVPAGTVVREAKRWAKALSMWGGLAMGAILQAVDEGQDMALGAAIENDAHIFAGLTATEDMREGVGAFLQKRRPVFKDK
jgi:enoyl-CoA hydratase/carnithine racemase